MEDHSKVVLKYQMVILEKMYTSKIILTEQIVSQTNADICSQRVDTAWELLEE